MRFHLASGTALFAIAVILWGACPHATHAAQDPVSVDAPGRLLPAVAAWEVRLPALPAAPGAHDDARLYVPLEDGALLAIDRATGARAWLIPSLGRSTPLAGGDQVFVRTEGALVAIDGATGRQLWRVSVDGVPDTASAPGAVAPGPTVVLRTGGGVLALRAEDGVRLWEHALPGAAASDHVTAGREAVYVTSRTGVTALGLTDGRLRWHRELSGVAGTPALAGDRLLVGTADKALVALHASSGNLAWRWRLGGAFVGAAAVDDLVYVAALDALLRALRRDGGNQVWRLELPTRPTAPPAVHGDVVAQAGNDPVLTAADARTGTVVGRHGGDGDLLGPPLIAPGADIPIVLLFQDGRVIGLRPDNQEQATEPDASTP